MATRKKKQEPVANTIMDFVTESPPVVAEKPKSLKVNGDDYFLVKVTGLNGHKSQHPVIGWKLSSWLKFYSGLNSIINVEYEISTKQVYMDWYYSPLEPLEEETKEAKKPRKKKEKVEDVKPTAAKKSRKKNGSSV